MSPQDAAWVQKLLDAKLLTGPVLDMGVGLGYGYEKGSCRRVIEATGLQYFGTDTAQGPAVDFIANFDNPEDMKSFGRQFGSILILNVLEHVFDPIKLLDNAFSIVKSGGAVAISTPAIWPLHTCPIDAWRPQPNFYEEYASRRGLVLNREFFEFVGYGRVDSFPRGNNDTYTFPTPCNGFRYWWSRAIHKTFNTCGRGMAYPSHVSIAALLEKPH